MPSLTDVRIGAKPERDYDDSNDYNGALAAQYVELKNDPFRKHVEEFSFMSLIGDLRNQNVIDIACGAGYFTRLLKSMGAQTVVGMDCAEGIISLARKEEEKVPLGIKYEVRNIMDDFEQRDFDVVVSAWLFVNARCGRELDLMCRGLARQVRPGGRFVMFTTNTDVVRDRGASQRYDKYGFHMEKEDDCWTEGVSFRWCFPRDNGEQYSIVNFYLSMEAQVKALEKAGFVNIKIHTRLSVSCEFDDPHFFDDFVQEPMMCMIEAVKT